MRRFVIARIHYSGIFGAAFKDNILDDLADIEASHGFINSDGYHWTIRGIEQIDADDARIIRGIITKIIPTQEFTVIDEETKKESVAEAEDIKDREGHFYIDIDANLIALETSGMMTKKQLSKVLVAGFLKAAKNYEPELDYTYDDHRIDEKLEKFAVAKYARFQLTATNPHANDEFKPLDDQYHRSNVAKADATYRPKPDGKLDISSSDSIVRQSLKMAAAGYGRGTIIGRDRNDKSITLHLGENLIDTIEVQETSTDDEVRRSIIVKFKSKDTSNA